MFTASFTRMGAKVDWMESSSPLRVIIEPVDARTDQILKASKVNRLITCYILGKM